MKKIRRGIRGGWMMTRVMAVGIFDLLHAGHLHYVEQAKSLGEELVVVIAHDETVRKQKHEPVTGQDLRRRMVEGLKPVDQAIIGNPPGVPIFEILKQIEPDLIALGYDQKHSIDAIRKGLDQHGFEHVEVTRVEGLSDDLDGTRKIIARILDLWPGTEGGPYEED
jgi:cytidyltransferase-related domain